MQVSYANIKAKSDGKDLRQVLAVIFGIKGHSCPLHAILTLSVLSVTIGFS